MVRLVTHPRRLDKLIFFLLKELSVNPPTEGTGSGGAAEAQSVSLPPLRIFCCEIPAPSGTKYQISRRLRDDDDAALRSSLVGQISREVRRSNITAYVIEIL